MLAFLITWVIVLSNRTNSAGGGGKTACRAGAERSAERIGRPRAGTGGTCETGIGAG